MLQKIKEFGLSAAQKTMHFVKEQSHPLMAIAFIGVAVILFSLGSVHTVKIFDGDRTYTVRSFSADAVTAMKSVQFSSPDYEITDIVRGARTTDIQIAYRCPLTVTVGSDTKTYAVSSGRLGDLLTEVGIKIDEYDIVSRSLDDVITAATAIDIVDIEYVTESYSQDIPFSSNVVYSDEYDSSTKKVISEGKTGTKVVTCSVKYVNGVATETTVVEEQVVEPAVDRTTVIGTSIAKMAAAPAASQQYIAATKVNTVSTLTPPSDLMLDANGIPVNYSSTATLKATAYTHTGHKCATGVAPQPGYIAVDPRKIPYGTKMYIASADGKYVYGYAIAADTGGFIHMNRDLDLFFDTEQECVNFGVRNVVVYFLD